MNLNTFARHGGRRHRDLRPTAQAEIAAIVAERLRNPNAIGNARALPYQLMVAYANADPRVPAVVKEALQDAIEVAIEGVPAMSGKIYVLPDISGSMHSPITGRRGSASSAVRCLTWPR